MGITPTAELPQAIRPPAPPMAAFADPTPTRRARTGSPLYKPVAIAFAALIGLGGAAGGIRAVLHDGTADAAGSRHSTSNTGQHRTGSDTGSETGNGGWISVDATNDTTPAVIDDPGTAGGSTLTDADLSNVYTYAFGVTAGSDTLDCIAGDIGGATGLIEDLLANTALSSADAGTAFTPFVECAPDADFVTNIVPLATQQLGGSADQNCIADGLVSMDSSQRVALLALAYSDGVSYRQWLASAFEGCAV